MQKNLFEDELASNNINATKTEVTPKTIAKVLEEGNTLSNNLELEPITVLNPAIPSPQSESEEREVYKCPVCKATIEKDVLLCGNCKTPLEWKDSIPIVSSSYSTGQALKGCQEASGALGCLLTLFITIPILLFGTCALSL